MTRTVTRSAALAAILVAALCTDRASAAPITSPVSLPTGAFTTTLSGSGNAHLTSASGNYRTWTNVFGLFISTNTGLSAGDQAPGLTMPNVNINNSVASGTGNITYDNLAPGTPLNLNSLNGDLNGVGGANQNYAFTIAAGALNVSATILGIPTTLPLTLTVNGLITDATFNSSGGSVANNLYSIPGTLTLTIQATVSGSISVLGIPISLGTLFTLPSTPLPIVTSLPGAMVLTDLSGGAGPYPANMKVDLAAATSSSVAVPVTLPFGSNGGSIVPDPGDHIQGITSLIIGNGSQLNLTLTLGSPGYLLEGTLPLALVPEPSSLALGALAMLGLVGFGVRRKRAA